MSLPEPYILPKKQAPKVWIGVATIEIGPITFQIVRYVGLHETGYPSDWHLSIKRANLRHMPCPK